MGCLDDDGGRAGFGSQPPQHLGAVHVGHDEVEQNQGDAAAIGAFEDLRACAPL